MTTGTSRRPPGAGSVTPTPAGLLTGLARAAIVAGVRGDLALALLDGAGDHAARLAVDLAAALLEVPAVARATG